MHVISLVCIQQYNSEVRLQIQCTKIRLRRANETHTYPVGVGELATGGEKIRGRGEEGRVGGSGGSGAHFSD